jgi:hypothetical protein
LDIPSQIQIMLTAGLGIQLPCGTNGDVNQFDGGGSNPTLTWHALLRRSHNRTVWSRDPDMNMSFFGDMQSETTLQIEQAPFEKSVNPENISFLNNLPPGDSANLTLACRAQGSRKRLESAVSPF